MLSLLRALEEGRLVELPSVDKNEAMEFLGLLLEAIPELHVSADLVEAVKQREQQFNTGLGKGLAVPHCRAPGDGELLCVVGWSPLGIDWAAPDGKAVHLIVMYYVPESRRNVYLKEISGLAKVLSVESSEVDFSSLVTLADLRDRLLSWIEQSLEAAAPDAKAKMIRLEARHRAQSETVARDRGSWLGFQAVCWEDQAIILTNDATLCAALESGGLSKTLMTSDDGIAAGYEWVKVSQTPFAQGRHWIQGVARLPR